MSLVYTLSPEPIGGFWPNSKATSIEHGEEMIRFCWLWPHFQDHTSTLNVKFWPKKLVCTLTLETNTGFWPNYSHCITGIIKISCLQHWPNFQGHHTIKTVNTSLSALHLLNRLVEFDQTCTETPLRHEKEMVRFWLPWPHFQGHNSTLNVKFWPTKSCLYPISCTK